MSKRKTYSGAASLAVGLSSISLLLILQLPRYATRNFGVAIATTGTVLCLLLGGIVLGGISRGALGWLGVVSCAVGLLLWGLMAIGILM